MRRGAASFYNGLKQMGTSLGSDARPRGLRLGVSWRAGRLTHLIEEPQAGQRARFAIDVASNA